MILRKGKNTCKPAERKVEPREHPTGDDLAVAMCGQRQQHYARHCGLINWEEAARLCRFTLSRKSRQVLGEPSSRNAGTNYPDPK